MITFTIPRFVFFERMFEWISNGGCKRLLYSSSLYLFLYSGIKIAAKRNRGRNFCQYKLLNDKKESGLHYPQSCIILRAIIIKLSINVLSLEINQVLLANFQVPNCRVK